MPDARTTFRYRTNRKAKIFLDSGEVIACRVRDVSPGGAGLEVDEPLLPARFTISIEGTGSKRRCRLAWQKGDLLGVEFI